MTEKLILMHENIPYFIIFSFFETFEPPATPPPRGAAPVLKYSGTLKNCSYLTLI